MKPELGTNAWGAFWWGSVLALGLMCGEASGLTIYRFGGAALPPPPEVGQEEVEFIPLSWLDLEASLGGETSKLDMDDTWIQALKYDPQVSISPTGTVRLAETTGKGFDGDPSSVWTAHPYICAELGIHRIAPCRDGYASLGVASIILQDKVSIDRIRVVSGRGDLSTIARDFRVFVAPEFPTPWVHVAGRAEPYEPPLAEVRDNRETLREVALPPHEPAGYLQVAFGEHLNIWEIAEIEIYAKGFVDKSTYVSNRLDFGAAAAWGEIRWSGRRDSGAEVLIQTRSGTDEEPAVYWQFTGRGEEKEEVTRSQYSALKVGQKAGITYDRNNWTFWSSPYDFADSSGASVVSLSPRRYLQLKVDFLPRGDSGGRLDFLEIRTSVPPVASTLVGEISPTQVAVGELARFTYILKPTIQGDASGFDRLEMASSAIFGSVVSLSIDGVEVPFQPEALEEHRFEIGFAKLDANSSGTLVEVVFDARVLRYGSSFDARVFDSSRPLEVRQGVNAGDATGAFEGNRVSVFTSIETKSLLAATVSPRIFTPNGDSVNDVVSISYDIFEITGPGAVTVAVLDLAGRLVRTVYAGQDRAGHYPRTWDGTDDAGELVAPGVYLYRVSVDADREQVDKIGTLYVAY
jgi:hypothetical protein